MKKLIAILALVVFATAADAGPIRDRLRARFAPQPVCVPCAPVQTAPPAVPYSAPVAYAQPAPVAVSPVVYTFTPNCPNGQCPLIRR